MPCCFHSPPWFADDLVWMLHDKQASYLSQGKLCLSWSTEWFFSDTVFFQDTMFLLFLLFSVQLLSVKIKKFFDKKSTLLDFVHKCITNKIII